VFVVGFASASAFRTMDRGDKLASGTRIGMMETAASALKVFKGAIEKGHRDDDYCAVVNSPAAQLTRTVRAAGEW
jgi:hypothetical protein